VSPGLEFRILGPFEVRSDGHPVELGARRQRALLAVLLLHANEVVSRDLLIEEVWGAGAPTSAPNMIQVYVSRLRKALGDGLLLTQAPGYVLRVGEAQLDTIHFSALVARAGDALAAGVAGAAREFLEEAIGLWRGPALADFSYESFAQGEVGRLEELRLEAIELRADADLALGRHSRLVGELEQLVALHPFRERLRAQLMLALYRSGRQAEALDAYRSARKTLVEELGIEPSPALQDLEQAILTQDRELDAPTEKIADGPPLREATPGGNLSPELTSLIGRDSDIARIAELVSQYRLVSVVGTGGVGKTRVAQRVARSAGQAFAHGAWLVDLAAIDAGDDVAGAVMSSVGIADRPGSGALETLVAELRNRRLLLLLDNCEHVIRSAAELAARLVTECHSVSILATSREPLAVTGERVARLEPLSTTANASADPPAAVALFLDRAASHGAACAHDDAVLETIREVCVRLDGIPLAIELAAARSRAISPAELLRHLDDRLRLLIRPRDWTTPARQQTLESTIAWSYELLGDEDRATLRRLSAFHGSFSLTAAVAVCTDIGAEFEILERVTGLVDRSVVSIERRGLRDHYRLLESIALFAHGRLRDEGEEREARDRHARYFLGFAQDTSGRYNAAESAARAERLDAEHDNLTAALGWCLDGDGDPNVGAELAAELGWHWVLRGRSNVAARWLQRALELRDRVAPPSVAAVYVAYAALTYSTSDLEASRRCASEAVAIARKIDDRDLLGEALGQLACACRWLDPAYAVRVTAELRSLQPFLSTPRAQSMSLIACALVALYADRPAQAVLDASSAREIARRAGDHIRAAWSGAWLAYGLALSSTIASARTAIAEATEDAIRSGYELAVVDNLTVVTTLALADDDADTVRRLLPKVVEMLAEQQRWEDLGRRLRIAAAVELRLGSPDRSAILLGAAEHREDRIDVDDEMLLPELAQLRDRLIAQLGARAFTHASARGAAMSIDGIMRLLDACEWAS
jgi:predicted ATPase/DNA-binding SARP family transcriptional activator